MGLKQASMEGKLEQQQEMELLEREAMAQNRLDRPSFSVQPSSQSISMSFL